MDYNNVLKKLRIEKNQTVEDIKDLDNDKITELNEAKRVIEEKYSKLEQTALDNLSEQTETVYNYCKLIEKNSTMSGEIFNIITELISVFEGEPYVIEKINYHKDKATPSAVVDSFMIMSKKVYENIKSPSYVRERYFHHLLKNGLAIKIVEDWSDFYLPDEISFYKADLMGRIEPQISFKGFPYVKQFVDYIINYRIENKVDELSEKDMQKLKNNFILLNINYIQDYYQQKAEQRIKENTESINLECIHNRKILRRYVNKIESNKQ